MAALNRSQPPEFQVIEHLAIIQPEVESLANGAQLYTVHGGVQPVLRLELIFKAGSWYEQVSGSSLFAAKMLLEGTQHKSSAQIHAYIDQFGAAIECSSGFDSFSITVYSVAKFLEPLLQLLQEILQTPVFAEEELEHIQKLMLQNLSVNLQKNSYVASQQMRVRLFGAHHPYGREMDEATIQQMNREVIDEFYKHFVKQKPFDIIASGWIGDTEKKLIHQYLGNLPIEPYTKSLASFSFEPLTNPEAYLVDKPESLQSSLRIATLTLNKKHPDYFSLVMLNEIFGGYFGSRLMKNIREDKGFTYGIYSQLANQKNAGYWVIGTDVKREFTQQTIDEIHKEARLLRQELVPEEELTTVKNYFLGSMAGMFATPFKTADRFKNLYLNELDYSYYELFFDSIHQITAEEILRTANLYLNTDTMLEIVIGGK
ncbi:MAG TPA: peptidase M16 [Microscillaceae bacterium]|jgi:predicted Zn-dependent peptidase|nr:peptidase M16 [Microscillaceae bacterium]